MKRFYQTLITMALCLVSTHALAYDIAAKNADSVMIYYNYISGRQALEVT